MTQNTLETLLVFSGLMATLGSVTKITLALINRRRGAVPENAARVLDEMNQRLARLEHAVDATAVEVERISEGQRFTTKVLAERGALDAGPSSARGRTTTPH